MIDDDELVELVDARRQVPRWRRLGRNARRISRPFGELHSAHPPELGIDGGRGGNCRDEWRDVP